MLLPDALHSEGMPNDQNHVGRKFPVHFLYLFISGHATFLQQEFFQEDGSIAAGPTRKQ